MSNLICDSRIMISKQFLNNFMMSVINDLCNSMILTDMKNFIILIISSQKNVMRIKSNYKMQHEQMKIFSKHAIINSKLLSNDKYVLDRLVKYLMSNILIIVKVVSEDNDFIIVSLCKMNNEFLST